MVRKIHILSEQNAKVLNAKQVVHIITTPLEV